MEDYRPRPSKFRISGNKKKKYLFLLKAMMDEINAVIDYVQKFKDSKTELEKLETNSKGVKCGYCNNSAETFSIYRFNLIRDVNYKDGRYTPVVRQKNFCKEHKENAMREFIEFNAYSYLKAIYLAYSSYFKSINPEKRFPKIASGTDESRQFTTELSMDESPVKILDEIADGVIASFNDLVSGKNADEVDSTAGIKSKIKEIKKMVFDVKKR